MNRRGWQQWDLSRPEAVRGGWGWFLEPQGSFSAGAGPSVEVRGQPGHPHSPHPLPSCLHLPLVEPPGRLGAADPVQIGSPPRHRAGWGRAGSASRGTDRLSGQTVSEGGLGGVRHRKRQLKAAHDPQTEDCWAHRVRMSERRLMPFIRSIKPMSSLQGRWWQSSVAWATLGHRLQATSREATFPSNTSKALLLCLILCVTCRGKSREWRG